VNKAADQYLVLDERARADLAAGKYQDRRKSSSVTDGAARPRARTPAAAPRPPRRAPAPRRPGRRSWTEAQERLAVLYSQQGMRPDEIAERLGLSRYTVTQLLLAAGDRVRR
jgi:DNA-binding CsgD family transcriptional regulator